MILHPGILSLLFGSLLIAMMLCYSAYEGAMILRKWDLASGSEQQLKLERKTYLVSTFVGYALVFQLFSLFLFIYTADSLSHLFTGAMCAAGSLNVNAFGYPTIFLKIVNFLLAGLWLMINRTDNQAFDYPLIKIKYRWLLAMTPLLVIESVVQATYLLSLEPNLITSCCSVIFDQSADTAVSWLVALPVKASQWAFGGTFVLVMATGLYSIVKRKAVTLFSFAALVFAGVAMETIISLISVYIYELPTHHCPFCILHAEYGYRGYFLYLALSVGTIAALAVATLQRFRNIPSLAVIIPAEQRFLTIISLSSLFIFFMLSLHAIIFSNLTL